MWPFGSKKRDGQPSARSGPQHDSLSRAVLAGDVPAVRHLLAKGADPNACDPGDTAYPIHYALNHGAAMVQLLIEHGADVNKPGRGDATPLAKAESRGLTEVAAVLRRHGARLRTVDDHFTLPPPARLKITSDVQYLITLARVSYPHEPPEQIAARVEGKLNLQFPSEAKPDYQQAVRRDVREIINQAVGIKSSEKRVATPEQVMRNTGMSEAALTREFIQHLIDQGTNPFAQMPDHLRRDAEQQYPDLVKLARRKCGA